MANPAMDHLKKIDFEALRVASNTFPARPSDPAQPVSLDLSFPELDKPMLVAMSWRHHDSIFGDIHFAVDQKGPDTKTEVSAGLECQWGELSVFAVATSQFENNGVSNPPLQLNIARKQQQEDEAGKPAKKRRRLTTSNGMAGGPSSGEPFLLTYIDRSSIPLPYSHLVFVWPVTIGTQQHFPMVMVPFRAAANTMQHATRAFEYIWASERNLRAEDGQLMSWAECVDYARRLFHNAHCSGAKLKRKLTTREERYLYDALFQHQEQHNLSSPAGSPLSFGTSRSPTDPSDNVARFSRDVVRLWFEWLFSCYTAIQTEKKPVTYGECWDFQVSLAQTAYSLLEHQDVVLRHSSGVSQPNAEMASYLIAGFYSREDAERILSTGQEGSFLIRFASMKSYDGKPIILSMRKQDMPSGTKVYDHVRLDHNKDGLLDVLADKECKFLACERFEQSGSGFLHMVPLDSFATRKPRNAARHYK